MTKEFIYQEREKIYMFTVNQDVVDFEIFYKNHIDPKR